MRGPRVDDARGERAGEPVGVAAWLVAVDPVAVLGDVCAGDVDRCVQVSPAPDGPGAAQFVDVRITGTGADAAVTVAAYTT